MPIVPWSTMALGIPTSVQTKSTARRTRWKAHVRAAAQADWPQLDPPLAQPLQLKITYFHLGTPLDVDNMIKPIQDALIGIAYDDDKRISDVHGSLRDLTGPFRLQGLTPLLARGFMSQGPFVYIQIEEPPNLEVLP